MSKKIPLTQGKFAVVDDEDYNDLIKYKWYLLKGRTTFYAARDTRNLAKTKGETILMHRQILKVPKNKETDHKNHNGLDCRKSNIRICSCQQNQANRKQLNNKSSKYKGVYWHKLARKWMVTIKKGYNNYYLGLFDDEKKAAKIYDKKAKELNGEFAYLNFGDEYD